MGLDLARWDEDKSLKKKRILVLERLRQKLNTTLPPLKKVEKRYLNSTDWNLEDVYSFRLKSGKVVLIHVIGFHQDKGGKGPVCEILDWGGKSVPDKKAIEKMGYIFAKPHFQDICQILFASLSVKDFQSAKVNLVAQGIKPKQKCGNYSVIFWRYIDNQFEQLFGLL